MYMPGSPLYIAPTPAVGGFSPVGTKKILKNPIWIIVVVWKLSSGN